MQTELPHMFLQVMRLIRDRAASCSTHSKLLKLAPPEFMTLKYFEEHPSATLSAFADFIHVRKPTATALIKKLLERGFLLRSQSNADKRAFELVLTPLGQDTLKEGEKFFEEHAGVVFSPLNAQEQEQLSSLLSKIIH